MAAFFFASAALCAATAFSIALARSIASWRCRWSSSGDKFFIETGSSLAGGGTDPADPTAFSSMAFSIFAFASASAFAFAAAAAAVYFVLLLMCSLVVFVSGGGFDLAGLFGSTWQFLLCLFGVPAALGLTALFARLLKKRS